jgi:hypothetical protein
LDWTTIVWQSSPLEASLADLLQEGGATDQSFLDVGGLGLVS